MQQSLSRIFLILCLFGLTLPTYAANPELDTLFEKLKSAPDETTARVYVNSIWTIWFTSGDSKVDQLMQQAMSQRSSYNFDAAIETLNQVIALKPDYSEAWNQRATVYFFKEDYEKSLEDVARTLELEPRHFGALAGRALIRLKQLKPALAAQNILKAMKIHPFLPERVLLEQMNLGI